MSIKKPKYSGAHCLSRARCGSEEGPGRAICRVCSPFNQTKILHLLGSGHRKIGAFDGPSG